MRYRNAGASCDLVIPVHLVCNTPEDILIANIKANSTPDRHWIGTEALKDKPCVMVGSGPSVADCLGEIDALHASGAVIFALNGAASYLASKGIYADYQVIADAREQTGDLVGPAKNYLFASQVHPSLLQKQPQASIFHVDFGDILRHLPGYDHEYVLMGSHGSVGNVALTVAYSMGYREMHVFGYDSSFRDEASHAFSQPMNVTEPITTVEYNGKKYTITFTMKSQANVFPRLAHDLEQLGCSFKIYGTGYLQDRWFGELAKPLEQREAEKYQEMWKYSSYLEYSPGLQNLQVAREQLVLLPGNSVIDFGCGAGFAVKELIESGIKARGVDIAPNALEYEIPFTQACLWLLPDMIADYGYCCDVMEHIPTEKVDDVLAGIARSVLHGCYFAIDSEPDMKGSLIGAVLHLTVRPAEWWVEQLSKHFATVEFLEPNIFVCRK